MQCAKCHRKVRGQPHPSGMCPDCRPPAVSAGHPCVKCGRGVRGRPHPSGVCPQCRHDRLHKLDASPIQPPEVQPVPAQPPQADTLVVAQPMAAAVETQQMAADTQQPAADLETQAATADAPEPPAISTRAESASMDEYLAGAGLHNVKSQLITSGSYKGAYRLYRPGLSWNATDAATLTGLGFVEPDGQPLTELSANGAWIIYARQEA